MSSRRFPLRTRAEPILNLEILDALAKAAAHRQQIELAYRKPGQPEAQDSAWWIRITPATIGGEWYLFAYDHARRATSAPLCWWPGSNP